MTGSRTRVFKRTCRLIVVDAAKGFGNGRCIPAGPLREPVVAGLARADLVLSIGPAGFQKSFAETWGPALGALPHVTGALTPLPTGLPLAGLPRRWPSRDREPGEILRHPARPGADLRPRSAALSDHQPLSDALMTRMLRGSGEAIGAQVVTTEKDAVRLSPSVSGKRFSPCPCGSDRRLDTLDAALDRLL
jgi:tetraacyldisaccharide 4'-kinase